MTDRTVNDPLPHRQPSGGQAEPADAPARHAALDPLRSFIVQAPAGSGKTEMLIQRLLVLLARVESPEEVVALTFTRKAAGEMRARVIEALHGARGEPPSAPHRHLTWALAREALARSDARGWALLEAPGRLCIQTIDGLCSTLVRRMPLTAELGGMPATADDAEPFYLEAARATLAMIETAEGTAADALATLLLHLDNDSRRVEALLVSMLKRRDQWIRHVAAHDQTSDRRLFEEAVHALWSEATARAAAELDPLAAELVRLAARAAGNLPADSASRVRACVGLSALPQGSDAGTVAVWRALCDLLLTGKGGEGDYRKKFDVSVGFPAASSVGAPLKLEVSKAKQDMLALVEQCSEVVGLRELLLDLRSLPGLPFDDAQWRILGATVTVLRLAAAQLEVVFAVHGVSDFTGIAQAAQRALGSTEQPTDLLLSLDARIRHLLIDEFQDTSVTQFALIEQLTLGWSEGDGRSLFLVGDPMQSIYRFREAEVALFLRARSQGIGSVRLQPLALSTNFRSVPEIVGWVNDSFAAVFPTREDELTGAVPLERAVASKPLRPAGGVMLHALVGDDAAAAASIEAARVVEAIRAARHEQPTASVAVLVRARSHLAQIVPALRAEGWPIRAVEIEALAERQIVVDLLSLTRALRHPADRVAWLAVLRAPWCGLTLSDLHALAGDDGREALWLRIAEASGPLVLSDDGRARLRCVTDALAPLLANARRASLRETVEAAWLRLGGPDCLRAPRDLDDANAYFTLLGEVEQAADVADLDLLDQRLARLFAAPDPTTAGAGEPIEVMTIHKAKGLEWDVVIVPGMHRDLRSDEARLLRWLAWPGRGGMQLLMGAMASRGGDEDRTHAWIGQVERRRMRLEVGRLLYVAATRARWQLHLLGYAMADKKKDKGLRTPGGATLLGCLWPAVAAVFERRWADRSAAGDDAPAPAVDAATGASVDAATGGIGGLDPCTWRLPLHPALTGADPRLPAPLAPPLPAAPGEPLLIEFSWAGETARVVGTVVHRWLQQMSLDLSGWSAARVRAAATLFEQELAADGVPSAERPHAVNRVIDALCGTLADPRAPWLLGPRDAQAQAASEWKLTGLDEGERVNVAIDRSFIDAGVRWVIDYKTGSHEGGDREAFMDREVERYRPQLARYARLLRTLGPEPVRCGLYFPLLGGWREFAP